MTKMNLRITFLLACFCVVLFFPSVSNAQRRDYLTEAEIELIRDAQEIDRRIEVLTKAVDRRFLVLNNQTQKESDKWGEPPTGTHLELFIDIQKILQKAIDDIDEIAGREGGMTNKLFPKAVHKLSGACQAYIPQFNKFLDSTKLEKERGALLTSIELCNQVIEASTKVPKEPTKEEKKKNKKDSD